MTEEKAAYEVASEIKPVVIEPWGKTADQFCKLGRYHWSVSRLIELSKDLPIIELPLCGLDLGYEKTYYPREFVMHMRAVLDADLSYPIIIDEDGLIMDGRHRILKALHLNLKTIKARRFDKNPNPCKVDE